MRIPFCGVILFFLVTKDLTGQVFSNQNENFGIEALVSGNIFGAGVSFHDFDGDNWDDLTFVLDDQIVFYRNNEGTCELFPIDVSVYGNAKHPTWVDFDNDGDKDLFVTHNMNYNKLYRNDGDFNMVDITSASGLSGALAPHYGCCWGDYDRDGDLDVYVCNYMFVYNGNDAYNYWDKLYRNNGNGTFTDVSVAAGISDGINSTFQAVWIDYNQDLWPDIYTINDKLFPNYLYHNNGDGTFTEVGEAAGVSIADVDAMTASCADMNNDGWEDIFVTNTSIGHCAMLKNNGDGAFIDIAESANTTLDVLAWAGNWMDFDLDMDQDLYVCEYFPEYPEQLNQFLRNLGNETFVNINSVVLPFDFSNSYTTASGDWDRDGYPDLTVSNYTPQNANFWLNGGGNQHYIKVSVEGTISNRDGVGTRIVTWSNGVQQMRYTRCGENYMGQDSDDEIFGLGNQSIVDSIFIHWPGGLIESMYNVPANQHLHLIEGGQFNAEILSASEVICSGDSILLDAGNYIFYMWDNGSTEQYRWITTPGEYSVHVMNESGFVDQATIQIYPFEIAVTNFTSINVSCYGLNNGSITIDVDDELAYVTMNNEDVGWYLDSLTAGEYLFEVHYGTGCAALFTVELSEPDPLYVDFEIEEVNCFGENTGAIHILETNAVGYSISWNNGLFEGEANNLPAGVYDYLMEDTLGCEISGEVFISQADSIIAQIEIVPPTCFLFDDGQVSVGIAGGTPPYNLDWMGEDSLAIAAGNYDLIITDSTACEISVEIFVDDPEPIVVTPEVICDDEWMNVFLTVTGGTGPYQYFWSDESTSSTLTNASAMGEYLVTVTDSLGCESVFSGISCALGTDEISKQMLSVRPNPATESIVITSKTVGTIRIYNFTGDCIHQCKYESTSGEIELPISWPAGCYMVQLSAEGKTWSTKLVVQ